MTTRRASHASPLVPCLLTALALVGCGDAEEASGPLASEGDATEAAVGEIHVEASADLFADAPFAAQVEATAPGVLASFDVEAWGSAAVDARLIASASNGAVVLEQVHGGASVTIEGGIALDGRLQVDLPGIGDYDGPIPGLEDHALRFEATRAIDVLATHGGGAARSDLATGHGTVVDLPGVDGRLVLAIGAESFVETHLVAECASADEDAVEIRGRLVTSGQLIVQPSLELDAPLVGAQLVALAEVDVTIEGEAAVIMSAHVEELASGDGSVAASLPACR